MTTGITTSGVAGFVPDEDPYFYASAETLSFLEKINRISAKHPVNVLVIGKQGCGKSSLVRQYAAVHRLPLATFQIGILSEPGQLFGEYALENGETKYKQFLFPHALQTPNCIIHLEEINRPEHPKALNMLFSILSDDRQVWMDELGLLRVADGVTFFATLNEGDEFVGTEVLDPALRDRFYVISMDYLPNDVEIEVLEKKTRVTRAQAIEIIDVVNILRGNGDLTVDVSTRKALMIGEMIAAGSSLGEAISSSLQTDRATLESILMSVHVKLNKVAKGKTEYVLFSGSRLGVASKANPPAE